MRSRASSRKWLSAAIRSMGGSRRSRSRTSSSRAARLHAETRRLAAQGWAVRGEVVDVCDHASIECAFDAALAARLMRPQRSGRMIVTTSVAAYQCEPAISAAYMTAKAGAAHLMRSVALELAADNITVNAIAPGFFATNIGGGHAKTASVQEAMGKLIPMHRVGFPADMAGLRLFLASPGPADPPGPGAPRRVFCRRAPPGVPRRGKFFFLGGGGPRGWLLGGRQLFFFFGGEK